MGLNVLVQRAEWYVREVLCVVHRAGSVSGLSGRLSRLCSWHLEFSRTMCARASAR